MQADLDVDDDPDQVVLEDDRNGEHGLVGFGGARDVDRLRMALRVANQRPLFRLGHPAGDSLADLDGQRFGGYTVVLGAMAIAEVDRAQRPAVIFQQVDAALVVGQQGRDGLADGLADLRHVADVREARPKLLDGVEMLRPGVRFRQPPVLQHSMIGGSVDGGFPGLDHH